MNIHKTQNLIRKARTGDHDSYDELFEHAASKLLLYVRLSLGAELRSTLESQDVLQETYLHAHRDFADFKPGSQGAFGNWLCAIARNRIRDLASGRAAARRTPPGVEKRLSLILEQVSAQAQPEVAAALDDERQDVERAVGALDSELREVVLLRFFEGRTIDLISKQLDIPSTSVRRRLGTALAKLGRSLDGLKDVSL